MGDTFNAFVKFISDDPIMLGLCIAIIVLVIMFIIVLIVGRKKELKIEKTETMTENNADLMKTDISLEEIKSTQEYNLSELNMENLANSEQETSLKTESKEAKSSIESVNETFIIEDTKSVDSDIMEIPVTTEEPIPVEIYSEDTPNVFDEQPASKVEEISAIEEVPTAQTNDIETDTVVEDAMLNITEPEPVVEPNIYSFENTMIKEPEAITVEYDTPVMNFPVIEEPQVPLEPLDETSIIPIIESSVNPIDNEPLEISLHSNLKTNGNVTKSPFYEVSANMTDEENTPAVATENNAKQETELPTITAPIPIVESSTDEPYDSVYLATNDIKPDFNIEDFDKTAILRHMPVMESMPTYEKQPKVTEMEPHTSEDSLEDIDLPKLNTDNDITTLNALKGESFEIN